jgi:translation initiation factor 3 subunit D
VESEQFPGGLLFLYARDDEIALKTMTVNETATDMPPMPDSEDDANHPRNLELEATAINQNFSHQILKRPAGGSAAAAAAATRKTFQANPFFNAEEEEEGLEPATVAYRYRRFQLGPYRLVARTELPGYVMRGGKEEYLTSFALNEWETQRWRQKIDMQKGSIIATELKNNSFKLAKWAAQSILAGADLMKVGFVSRVSQASAIDHLILGTTQYKPVEFAERMLNLKVTNMWGIVKWLCDKFLAPENNMEPGKYVLLKDPNKATLRVYAVPLDAFEGEEDEEEDEDEDEDEYEEDGAPGGGAPAEEEEDEGPDAGGSNRQFSGPPQPGAK